MWHTRQPQFVEVVEILKYRQCVFAQSSTPLPPCKSPRKKCSKIFRFILSRSFEKYILDANPWNKHHFEAPCYGYLQVGWGIEHLTVPITLYDQGSTPHTAGSENFHIWPHFCPFPWMFFSISLPHFLLFKNHFLPVFRPWQVVIFNFGSGRVG